MKRFTLILLIALIVTMASAQEMVRKMLPNGMEVIVKQNDTNSSAGVYCFVKTGSNFEEEFMGCGLSHYLEHLVSSGTNKFHTEDEYQDLYKKYGLMSNAYTSYFVTAYHLTGEATYVDSMITYISEMVSSCGLNQFEIDREKEVILKEIVMRSSPIRAKINQRGNEIFYSNSPMKNPVIGYVSLFKDVTRDDLVEYYNRHYVPNNMIFVVVGNIDVNATMTKIEDAFADFERARYNPVVINKQTAYPGNQMVVEEFETENPLVTMKYIIPGMTDYESRALTLAMHNLFGPRKAPIAFKLKEELKLVTSVNGYARPESKEMLPELNIYFSPIDPADINKIIKLIDDEIVIQLNKGLSEKRAQDYVGRYKAWSVMKSEKADSECNTIGLNMLSNGIPFTLEGEIEMMEDITVADMEDALRRFAIPKNRLAFCAVPMGAAELVTGSQTVLTEKSEFKRLIDNKNISLMIKENHKKPVIDVEINISTTTDFETKDNWNHFEAVADMLMRGSKKYDSLDLTEWFENHLAYPEVSISRYGIGIKFNCIKDDYPELQTILLGALNNPTFDENELELYRQDLRTSLKRAATDVGTAHRNFRNMTIYGDTKNGVSRKEVIESQLAMEKKDYQKIVKKYFHGQKLTIVYVGDITEAEAIENANELRDGISSKKISGKKEGIVIPKLDGTFENPYDFEQVNVDINIKAPKQTDEDYYAFFVMNRILSGSNGRLHEATRGTNNLAYFAYASYSGTPDYGFCRVTSQTSLDKKDQLIQTLQEQLDKMVNELVTEEEIALTVGEYEQQIKAMISDENIAGFIMNTELMGNRFEDKDKEIAKFKVVTPEQVKAVAGKYLDKRAVIVSFPNENVKKLVD